MSSSNLRRATAVAILAAMLATSGCNWLRGDRTGYQKSRETRPLEVPPDLDTPSGSAALRIPEPGSGARDASAAPATAAVPPSVPGATPAPAPSPSPQSYVGSETTLVLGDEVGSAFRRVSLALERSGVMTVVAKDESAGTVTLKQETTKSEGGFIKRMFGRGGTRTESVTRVVRIAAEGAGSRVTVEDESGRAIEDESARQIIAAVKQRLG